jgi:transposase
VIDYETFARTTTCRDRQGLTIIQIARALGLNRKTVAKWLARPRPATNEKGRVESGVGFALGALQKAEIEKWAPVIKVAHIKGD